MGAGGDYGLPAGVLDVRPTSLSPGPCRELRGMPGAGTESRLDPIAASSGRGARVPAADAGGAGPGQRGHLAGVPGGGLCRWRSRRSPAGTPPWRFGPQSSRTYKRAGQSELAPIRASRMPSCRRPWEPAPRDVPSWAWQRARSPIDRSRSGSWWSAAPAAERRRWRARLRRD